MKNNFNLDELDDFLSESAEQHRMYPSDKVWRNIDHELHGSKRWPALTFCAVLTVAIITAGLILIHPDKNLFTVNLPVSPGTPKIAASTTSASATTSPLETSTDEKGDLSKGRLSNTTTGIQKEAIPAIALNSLKNAASYPEQTLTNTFSNDKAEPLPNELYDILPGSSIKSVTQEAEPTVADKNNVEEKDHLNSRSYNVLEANIEGSFHETTERSNLKISPESNLTVPDIALHETIIKQSVVNSTATKVKALKNTPANWNMLFYITPSVSYRYLSEAKIVDLHQQNGPLAPNFTHGVNNFVRHKPIAGYEIGTAFVHNITPSVRLRAGLQANIRGYSIEAYASKREPSTIVLNRGFYTDSLVSISTISNQQGYKPMEITNRYFELSIPVALDLRMANWKKVQVYVAAGLQPTYQFNKSMYMVSSDYKNYIQDPDLVRHFNLNTSIEAFISYKAGGVTWQVGPQIRYQLLPGATNQYPVRERLIDYGFKIGVVKTLH